jgi:hypothetical protein
LAGKPGALGYIVVCDRPPRFARKATRGISPPQKEATPMSEIKLPKGWDEAKVRRVLAHYEEQTEAEALIEDEAGIEPAETVMASPDELVPEVRERIAKRRR